MKWNQAGKLFFGILAAAFWAACASPPQQSQAGLRELRLGTHHFAVSTKSKEAQRAFDRGLTLAYSFAHRAAEAEFRKAADLDPQLAMAWWGVALVSGPHINFPAVPPDRARVAWEGLTKARELAGGASELERALINALAKRYAASEPEDRSPLDQAYANAMREVWAKHPSNADVAVLFAESMMDLRPWDLWQPDGTPQPGTLEIVATLEQALRLNPKHPGANHYYIHTVEASPHPEKAEKAADRLGKLVPEAGHMVHMPAHIYVRVRRWADAADSNVRAMKADGFYRAKFPRPGFYAMYMAHNAHFLGWTAMVQGRSDEAVRRAREMVKAVPEDFVREFGAVVDGFLVFPHEALMRFGKWQELLDEPTPPGDLPLSQALWRYSRAAAFTALNRMADAKSEWAQFESAAKAVPAGLTFGNNPASNLLAIASQALAGEMAAKEKRYDEAIAHLQAGIMIEDSLRYDEPPDWVQPVRHTLGAVLLKAGKPAEAEKVYREDLKKYPENGWSLFGLAKALRAQNKAGEAAGVERRFAAAWKNADVKLAATCFCLQ
jgi:tetratricopeptide (TPR) repeat protein